MGRVLVIDDDHAICWCLRQVALQMRHEVFIASSAEEGLQLAERYLPSLIFLDVRLPGMDGLQALEQLRRLATACPVVLMSAYCEPPTVRMAKQRGAAEFLAKPFALAEVRAVMGRYLVGRSSAASGPVFGHSTSWQTPATKHA